MNKKKRGRRASTERGDYHQSLMEIQLSCFEVTHAEVLCICRMQSCPSSKQTQFVMRLPCMKDDPKAWLPSI